METNKIFKSELYKEARSILNKTGFVRLHNSATGESKVTDDLRTVKLSFIDCESEGLPITDVRPATISEIINFAEYFGRHELAEQYREKLMTVEESERKLVVSYDGSPLVKMAYSDFVNFVNAINYLRDDLKQIDVSGDFAPDESTSVNAYELITQSAVFDAIIRCIWKAYENTI